MNIEFHYYVTYLIALKAGFNKRDSYKVAYSSQFVDDNKSSINVVDERMKSVYKGTQTQIEMLCSGNKRDFILQKHHFLPGDSDVDPLMTTPNSTLAKSILQYSLDKRDVYLIGIASHAYMDTWAHQSFTGSNSELNSMPSWNRKIIPNIGHADAFDDPDSLDCNWIDLRNTHKGVIRNSDRFFEASVNLYSFYYTSITGKILKDPTVHMLDLKKIFRVYRSKFRIGRGRMVNKRRDLYDQIAYSISGFNIPKYDECFWMKEALLPINDSKISEGKYRWRDAINFTETDWWQFNEAAKHFQDVVITNNDSK